MSTNKTFMAFATGKESTENEIKRYIGVAPVYVLAVNPSKSELEKLYQRELENEPEYVSQNEIEGTKYPQVRLDFIIKSDVEKTGIETVNKVAFFLTNKERTNKDGSKVQVINKYGETTWLSVEDAKTGNIPENLNWFDASDMRPAYMGEQELTEFIKTYLNIPNKSYKRRDGVIVELPNLADAEARLDDIDNYFKGNVSELTSVIKLQPKNKIKCMFGVKTTDTNKQYQAVYNQKFLKNNVTDYSRLEADLESRKSFGAYPTTEFSTCDLQEYKIEPTKFGNSSEDDKLPFGNEAESNSPWFK